MDRKTILSLALPLFIVAVGIYAVQFGIMGFQPHLVENDEGDPVPVFIAPPENEERFEFARVTNESDVTVEQTGAAESSGTGSSFTCISDGRDVGSFDMDQNIVLLNDDRERGDPNYYRVDHTGTVRVANSNREVYIEEYVPGEKESRGTLMLGLRKKHTDEPESACTGELSFTVSIRYNNDIPDMRVGFSSMVRPPANETAE